MSENKELYYLMGQRALLLQDLKRILKELKYMHEDVDISKEQLIAEREEAISALRLKCKDNNWNEHLHLADIINKHL